MVRAPSLYLGGSWFESKRAHHSFMFGGELNEQLRQPYFRWVFKLFEAHCDAEIFLVGGAVRDTALGRQTRDYDFVVRGLQARKLQDFLAEAGIVNLVGRTFGVYKFIPDEGYEEVKASGLESFDIALPRTEASWGTGGYRDVEVQSNHELPIEEDLSRRDFTINAMALRLGIMNHELRIMDTIDPYGGQKDIETRLVRAVGEARQRFEEDYTRMLRALRFACELGFTVKDETMEALKAVMPRINDLRAVAKPQTQSGLATTDREFVSPREMVSTETLKAFYASPMRAFDLYDESGAFEALMPELLKMKGCPQPEEYHSEGDVWAHTKLALENLKTPEYKNTFGDPDPHYNVLLIMAILFHDIGKPYMLKTPEEHGVDRVRFEGHAEAGAGLTREIARRLVLSIMEEGPLHVDYDKLHWLVNSHLLLLHSDPEELKASTVEKYFFNPKNPGPELLRLAFCDGSATLPKSGSRSSTQQAESTARSAEVELSLPGKGGGAPNLSGVHGIIARIERMRRAIEKKQISPKSMLNGEEIMVMLNIPAGPGVGEIKAALVEEQLSARITSKEAAKKWVKEQYG